MLIWCSVFADTFIEGTRPVSISPNGMPTEAGLLFFEMAGIIFSPLWYPVGTNWVPARYHRESFWKQVTVFMPCKVLMGELYQIWALAWLCHMGALNSRKDWPWGFNLYFEVPLKRAKENICWVIFPPIRLCWVRCPPIRLNKWKQVFLLREEFAL